MIQYNLVVCINFQNNTHNIMTLTTASTVEYPSSNMAEFSTSTFTDVTLVYSLSWNSSTNTTQNVTHIERDRKDVDVIALVYLGACFVLAIVLNVFVLVTIKHRHSLHTPTYIFIANIAVGDLTFALFVYPVFFQTFLTHTWILGAVFCQIHAYVIHILAFQTLLSLMYISIDRFIAMCKPLRYQELMTDRKCYVMVAHTWIHSILTYMPPLLGWGKYQYIDNLCGCLLVWSADHTIYISFTGVTFYSAVIVIGFCYINIYRVIRKMNQSLQPMNHNSTFDNLKKEIRSSLWIFLTIITFLTCYIVYVSVRISKVYVMQSDLLTQFEYYTQVYLFITQNWLNPCIYGLLNRDFRRQFMYLFK